MSDVAQRKDSLMKIVILNGSPRLNGNTRTLLKEFEKGVINNLKDSEIEFVDLSQKNINPCDACDACIKLKGQCIHKDDTNDLMSKITAAEVIVFGSPVYWWGISTQLKSIIDKFYSWQGLDYNVPNKKIGIIAVGGSSTEDPQYQLISDQFKYISNFLKWHIRFDEAFSAYNIGDIKKDESSLKLCNGLYRTLTE